MFYGNYVLHIFGRKKNEAFALSRAQRPAKDPAEGSIIQLLEWKRGVFEGNRSGLLRSGLFVAVGFVECFLVRLVFA